LYAAGDLTNPTADCKDAPCEGVNGGAFNQGITIDIMTIITLPTTTEGVTIADFDVTLDSGTVGDELVMAFSDDVGSPKIATVAVHGGLSYAPDTQTGASVAIADCFPEPGLSSPTVTPGARDVNIAFTTAAASDVTVEVDGQSATSSGTNHNVTIGGLEPLTLYDYTITATSVDGGCEEIATGDFDTLDEVCFPNVAFTITIESGEVDKEPGSTFDSTISLNLNADGSQDGVTIQGWSYGICVVDPAKLKPIATTIEGTDVASSKEGDPPDFDAQFFDDNGASHAVTIDIMTIIQIPAENDYSDLVVTFESLMDTPGDSTFVTSCNKKIGSPPVENVVVIQGRSNPFSEFEGTDPDDPDGGCCDENPETRACNTPGEIKVPVPPPFLYVLAGDANGDGGIDLADGIFILNYLFQGGPEPPCMTAADFNDDDAVDTSDAVASIFYVLQPTAEDLQQLIDPEQYGAPPWPGPAIGMGCVEVDPEDAPLGCVQQCQ
jgi:hypothetical protein